MKPDPIKTTIPILLALTGLIPFLIILILLWLDNHPNLIKWFVAYGAVILSFLGAINWGLALARKTNNTPNSNYLFVFSVIPALSAWVALVIAPGFGLGLLIISYAVHLVFDQQICHRLKMPNWYIKLRMWLSCLVILMMVLALSLY